MKLPKQTGPDEKQQQQQQPREKQLDKNERKRNSGQQTSATQNPLQPHLLPLMMMVMMMTTAAKMMMMMMPHRGTSTTTILATMKMISIIKSSTSASSRVATLAQKGWSHGVLTDTLTLEYRARTCSFHSSWNSISHFCFNQGQSESRVHRPPIEKSVDRRHTRRNPTESRGVFPFQNPKESMVTSSSPS